MKQIETAVNQKSGYLLIGLRSQNSQPKSGRDNIISNCSKLILYVWIIHK